MKNQKGMSYIEIILFIVILGLAIPPLLIVTANIYNQSMNLETMHIGTNLASQKMEEVISKDFDSIIDEAQTNFTGQFNAYQYQVSVDYVQPTDLDTSVDPTTTNYKRVTIAVQEPGVGSRTITFKTVVTNE